MLSSVVLAHNEGDTIARVVTSLDFSDEVLVIDNASIDNTALTAKKHGAKVVLCKQEVHDFSRLRNMALQEAKGEWILYIDSDEVVSEQLKQEIQETVAHPQHDVYYIKRQDVFWQKQVRFGEVWQARRKGIIRLIKKGSGKWEGKVHEVFMTKAAAGTLQSILLHNAHASISGFLEKINFYSTLRAEELYDQKKRAGIFSLIVYPTVKFIVSFFLLFGFIDGAVGFVYSFMMSFHSFLVRSKLYLKNYSHQSLR